VLKNIVDIRLNPTAFQTGGRFAGLSPKDVQFILGSKSNSNQSYSDYQQPLRVTYTGLSLTKEAFGRLGVAPKLELAELYEQGILYVKYNNRILSAFEISNFCYDIITKVKEVQDLSVGPLSMVTEVPVAFTLDKVLISFSGNVTETVTVSYITSDGDAITLDTQNLAAVSVYSYIAGVSVQELDQIRVTCTDNNHLQTATAYIFIERRFDGQ